MDEQEDLSNVSLKLDSSGDDRKSDEKGLSETDDESNFTTPSKRLKLHPKINLTLTPVVSLAKMTSASGTDKIPPGICATLNPSKSSYSLSTTTDKHSHSPSVLTPSTTAQADKSQSCHSPSPFPTAGDKSKPGRSSPPAQTFTSTTGSSLTKPSTGTVTGQIPPGITPSPRQDYVQVEESAGNSPHSVVEAAQPEPSQSNTPPSTPSPATSLTSTCSPPGTGKIPPVISFSRVQPPSATTKHSAKVSTKGTRVEKPGSSMDESGSKRVLTGLGSISVTLVSSTSNVNQQAKSQISHQDDQTKECGVVQKDQVLGNNKKQVIHSDVIDLTSDVIDIEDDEPLKIEVKVEDLVKNEKTNTFRFPREAESGGVKAEPDAVQFQGGRYGVERLGGVDGGQPRGRGMIRGTSGRGRNMTSGPGRGARRQLDLAVQGPRFVRRSGQRFPTAGPQYSPVGHMLMPGVRAIVPGVRPVGPRGRGNAAPAGIVHGKGGVLSPTGSGRGWARGGRGAGWSPAGRGALRSSPIVRGALRSPAGHLVRGNLTPRGGGRGRGSVNPGVAVALVLPASGDENTELKIVLNPAQVEVIKNCFTNN